MMETRPIRACGNCFAFDDGECLNGVGIVAPADWCDLHRTIDEYRAWPATPEMFRSSMEPNRPGIPKE